MREREKERKREIEKERKREREKERMRDTDLSYIWHCMYVWKSVIMREKVKKSLWTKER